MQIFRQQSVSKINRWVAFADHPSFANTVSALNDVDRTYQGCGFRSAGALSSANDSVRFIASEPQLLVDFLLAEAAILLAAGSSRHRRLGFRQIA